LTRGSRSEGRFRDFSPPSTALSLPSNRLPGAVSEISALGTADPQQSFFFYLGDTPPLPFRTCFPASSKFGLEKFCPFLVGFLVCQTPHRKSFSSLSSLQRIREIDRLFSSPYISFLATSPVSGTVLHDFLSGSSSFCQRSEPLFPSFFPIFPPPPPPPFVVVESRFQLPYVLSRCGSLAFMHRRPENAGDSSCLG